MAIETSMSKLIIKYLYVFGISPSICVEHEVIIYPHVLVLLGIRLYNEAAVDTHVTPYQHTRKLYVHVG